MNYFTHRSINTSNSWMIGTQWTFRNATVEMHKEGFTCTCKNKLTSKCNHIKSVELGILGVGANTYKVA